MARQPLRSPRATSSAGGSRRTGRRPGKSTTHEEILSAARDCFAEAGYDGATMREIARRAGVAPALIVRFYGSKERLFQEAVGWPFDPAAVLPRIVAGDRRAIGRRLAEVVVAEWESGAGSKIVALARAAGGNEQAATLLRSFLTQAILMPLAEAVGGEDARVRVALASTQLLGTAQARYVLRLEPLASLTPAQLVDALAEPLQRLLAPR